MKSILIREIKSFFGSPIGYLVIAIFLLLNGLFLWVFEGDFNIMKSGFADLSPFFTIAPWILIFLIPAVTMRSFSDEKKQGTIELLMTKPLSIWQIVNGKFLGAFLLIVIAIIPTFIYVYVISALSLGDADSTSFSGLIYILVILLLNFLMRRFITNLNQNLLLIIDIISILICIILLYNSLSSIQNIDMGSTLGSYFGLLFLIAGYTSIGIFTSTLSENQIIAFITSVFLCFVFYFGFEGIATFIKSFENIIAAIGMDYHFKSMGRGVIDSRDVIYFVSITILFLSLTVYKLKSLKS